MFTFRDCNKLYLLYYISDIFCIFLAKITKNFKKNDNQTQKNFEYLQNFYRLKKIRQAYIQKRQNGYSKKQLLVLENQIKKYRFELEKNNYKINNTTQFIEVCK